RACSGPSPRSRLRQGIGRGAHQGSGNPLNTCRTPCSDRALEHAGHPLVRSPLSRACQGVANLAENLALTGDRALQPGGDSEQLTHCPIAFHAPHLLLRGALTKAVQLDPVARRQQYPLPMELAQLGERCGKLSSPVDVQLTRLDDQCPGLPSTHRQICLKLTNPAQICVTAATRPSTLGRSAWASTRKPLSRATSEVAGAVGAARPPPPPGAARRGRPPPPRAPASRPPPPAPP